MSNPLRTVTPLRPFGILVEGGPDTSVSELRPEDLAELADEHRVVVLRGFAPLDKQRLIEYGTQFGEILQWDFGAVLDLVVDEDPKNYLFANSDVPFHWDGAFTPAAPKYFLFQCLRSDPGGGETVFCDTTKVYAEATEVEREAWDGVKITYQTNKVAHYGGQCVHNLVGRHPRRGVPVLRYAEPLDPERYLNPLFLDVEGIPPASRDQFLEALGKLLHEPRYCYPHEWRTGDFVIADNDSLIHGRNAYTGETSRHLMRIQVLESSTTRKAGE